MSSSKFPPSALRSVLLPGHWEWIISIQAMGPGVFSILTLCLSCNQTVYQEGYQQILCALLPLDGTGAELKKP